MRIRQAVIGDEAVLRDLRLRAMLDAPAAYSSTYERNLARTTDEWTEWLASVTTFFLEADDGATVGLFAVATPEDEPTVRDLMSMWVDPIARGRGGGQALVEAAVAWSRADGGETARIWVYAANEPAFRLYQRAGFTPTGQTWDDTENDRLGIEMEQPLR